MIASLNGTVTVRRPDHVVIECAGVDVGVAGTKGFMGGFEGSFQPDFGEPSLRALYRETGAEVVHLQDALAPTLGLVASSAAWRMGLPVVGTFHTWFRRSPGYWAFRRLLQPRRSPELDEAPVDVVPDAEVELVHVPPRPRRAPQPPRA